MFLIGLAAALAIGCSSPTEGTMKGIVVDVSGDLTSVSDFTVLVEGDNITFEPSPNGDYDFPLVHLRDHLRSGEPVLVGWEQVDNKRVAVTLADG